VVGVACLQLVAGHNGCRYCSLPVHFLNTCVPSRYLALAQSHNRQMPHPWPVKYCSENRYVLRRRLNKMKWLQCTKFHLSKRKSPVVSGSVDSRKKFSVMVQKSWVLTLWEFVGRCQRFGRTLCFHLHGLKWPAWRFPIGSHFYAIFPPFDRLPSFSLCSSDSI
jgi:hypothetical protein